MIIKKTYNHTEQYGDDDDDDDDDSANDGDNDNDDDDDDGRLPRWRTTKYWTIIPSRSNSPPQVFSFLLDQVFLYRGLNYCYSFSSEEIVGFVAALTKVTNFCCC